MSRLVACPHCKTEIKWNEDNQFRPFCCERCKLQDLGAWFLEERSIKGQCASGIDEYDFSDLTIEANNNFKSQNS